ncbi:hypothetical protein DEU38_10946 [Rhodococcus sp. AG1013]|uniref:hypothetical protein n=1 Tax=Rhodococcus sp. AG1013 TaxID=2183996 RepID=UPI000E0A8BD3|nr:hypothetical protein [Rhodococcus sp. AG1013]RDI25702.1 hypothetical protein DEU38_10946 [Rhodococcus sp. AG1013]
MEPIEINAGSWYLRALRADERVDDRPALRDGGIADPGYVAERSRQWAADEHYSWAVCAPTTGELLAEVGVAPSGDAGVLSGWARPGHDDVLATATDAVRRFAEGALGLTLTER